MSRRRLYFIEENLTGTATTACLLLPYGTTVYHVEEPLYVARLTLMATEARTAGELDIREKVSGVQGSTDRVTLDADPTRLAEVELAPDAIPLDVGDTLGFDAITASWTPTTSDAILIVELEDRA